MVSRIPDVGFSQRAVRSRLRPYPQSRTRYAAGYCRHKSEFEGFALSESSGSDGRRSRHIVRRTSVLEVHGVLGGEDRCHVSVCLDGSELPPQQISGYPMLRTSVRGNVSFDGFGPQVKPRPRQKGSDLSGTQVTSICGAPWLYIRFITLTAKSRPCP